MIARSKFNALIFDTETCFKNEHQGLIAEIGWTFGNVLNQQDTPTTRRFLVADTLLNPNYWLHSQKFEKI